MSKKRGTYYIGEALNQKFTRVERVRPGKGDHYVIDGYDENGNFIRALVPVNLKGNGTECKIIKILKAMGVILVLSGIFYISIFVL